MSAAQRRAQILATACEMLESRSAEEVSVETVAAAIGVSPALLFHYFGSQREFRRAVVEAAAADLLAQMRPDPALSPADRLHAALDTFTAAVARHPGLYLAVVRSDGELSAVHTTMRDVLGGWLAAGLADAGAPSSPALTVTLAGWLAFTEEAITTWLNAQNPGNYGQLTRTDLVALCERAFRRLLEEVASVPW